MDDGVLEGAKVRLEPLAHTHHDGLCAAIARLGAVEEGVLRSHMVMRDGWVRDSVVFSITRQDWPGVKQHLTALLHPVGTDS